MSSSLVSVQEVSEMYTLACCTYATCALLVYDWLLCFSQEARFIWKWHSNVTGFLLVYAFSRYAVFIQIVLAIASNFSMSDRSCRVVAWTQNITWVLGTIAYAAFPALRAYALSNRNKWLSALIVLLALLPAAMSILKGFNVAIMALPSPINCTSSNLLSPTLTLGSAIVWRASQIGTELLVIGITWWYTYQSYRIRKGVQLGKSISSLLVYNGSAFFMFFAALYIIDIIFHTAPVPDNVLYADAFLQQFFDPMTSILTCRFMLSLRQFDSNIVASTDSEMGSHTAFVNMPLQFAAQPSDTLPSFIASFAHPVHIESDMSETDSDGLVDDGSEWREMDDAAAVAPTHWQSSSLEDTAVNLCHSPAPERLLISDDSV